MWRLFMIPHLCLIICYHSKRIRLLIGKINKCKWITVAYQRAPPLPDHLPGSPLWKSDAAGCSLSSGRGGTAESSHTSQKIHIQGTEEGKKAVGHFEEVPLLTVKCGFNSTVMRDVCNPSSCVLNRMFLQEALVIFSCSFCVSAFKSVKLKKGHL